MADTKPFYDKEIRGINLKLVYGFFAVIGSVIISTVVITNKVTSYVSRVDSDIEKATLKAETADRKASRALQLLNGDSIIFIHTLNTKQ